tara:strand:+ start:273 stop:677 length:405 start_codon:yes stop_codon:yes gene_type:complete
MARTPFKMKSGNSPLQQNIFKGKEGYKSKSIKSGLDKFFGSISKTLGGDIKRKREDITSLGEDIRTNVKLGTTKKSKASSTNSKKKEAVVVKKSAATDYSSMSVNALVKLRKGGNKDVQKTINAKLKENPNKWD